MSWQFLAQAGVGRMFVAFHGTGGDERQMLRIVQAIDPDASYFSPRGKSLEGGVHARYFRRFGEGVLDIPDLLEKEEELAQWLPGAIAAQGLDLNGATAIGYSNGATISSALLLLHPALFSQVILLRPMVPFVPEQAPDLAGKRVLICASPDDTVTPFAGAQELETMLQSYGAEVTFATVPGGHAIGPVDIAAAQAFLS